MERIESITIVHEPDTDPDTSYIGEYTDRPDNDWVIDRAQGEYVAILQENEDYTPPKRGREYRYFAPYAGDAELGSADYQKYGKQDFERMESLNNGGWNYIGIYAVAAVVVDNSRCAQIQEIRSDGLWGIESDSGAEYLAEVEGEEIANLTEQLIEFGFSADEIAAAEIVRR